MGRIIYCSPLNYYYGYKLKYYFQKHFNNKTVAVVGGAPNLVNSAYGQVIDACDVIVRINLLNNKGNEYDLGRRTDFRFIGATLLNKHEKYIESNVFGSKIITTRKNTDFMTMHNLRPIYYPPNTPMHTYAVLQKMVSTRLNANFPQKPPKSGLVFVALLLRHAKPKKILLAGFSKCESEAWGVLRYTDKKIQKYDKEHILRNHCDPSDEIRILNILVSHNLVELI
jgi:hypothetical protein